MKCHVVHDLTAEVDGWNKKLKRLVTSFGILRHQKTDLRMFAQSLCFRCTHRKEIRNKRNSVFLLCQKSKKDDRFPKYPPQPVLRCIGFEETVSND